MSRPLLAMNVLDTNMSVMNPCHKLYIAMKVLDITVSGVNVTSYV